MTTIEELIAELNKLEDRKNDIISRLYDMKVPLFINNGKIEEYIPDTRRA